MPTRVDRRQALALMAGTVLCLPAAGMRREQHFLFGSPVELLLPATTPQPLVDGVIGGLAAVHRGWNAWKPGEVSALNQGFRDGCD